MSTSTSIIYGRGFETEKLSLKTILQFVKNHEAAVISSVKNGKEIIEKLSKVNFDELSDKAHASDNLPKTVDDVLDTLAEFDESGNSSELNDYAGIIAEIINTENNDTIRLQFERAQSDECEGKPSVLLSEQMPWNLSEQERSLTTEEAFDEFLLPYVEELGLTKDDIDYLKIEYYG